MRKKEKLLRAALAALLYCAMVLACTAGLGEAGGTERLPDSELMTYYNDSVFAGDSLICMFRNYVRAEQKADPAYFAGIDFRCAYSYTLQMATWEKVREEGSANLSYKGRNMTLSQIAETLQPKKLFVLAGLNDNFARNAKQESGVERGLRYVETAAELVKKASPETEIFFLTLTPVTQRVESKRHVQEIWDEYNRQLEIKCGEIGAGFIDVASALKDENGLLPSDWSHDKEYHLNEAGNAIFAGVLLDYAQAQYEAGAWKPDGEP